MTTTAVAPPDSAVWWDAAQVRNSVLHQLRLQTGDIDEARIDALIPAAGYLIDNYLDRCDAVPGPDPNPLLLSALEQVTIELYRRKDSPSATSTDWNGGRGLFRAGAVDPLSEVESILAPFKQRHGVA